MTPQELLAHALALPGAWPDEPWEGDVVAKVGKPGKIFLFGGGEGVALKVPPDDRAELMGAYPGTVVDAPYLSKRHWVRVRVPGAVPDDELLELVEGSHRLVVAGLPKGQRPPSDR
jgi:predicted DNA-binding protein (MmcQ/YjbR family)